MNSIDQAIIITLGSVAAAHGKPYCFPSQAHILTLLDKYHGIKLSLRSLNRHLLTLQLDRFFERTRRHRKGKDGKIIFNTTLYKLKKKFFTFAAFMKFQAAKFFSVFRVPKTAQYSGTTSQRFEQRHSGSPSKDEKDPLEGAPKGRLSGNQVSTNLERLRGLLKSIGQSS